MIYSTRGDSKLGCLVLLALAAGAVYAGLQWGYSQWDYEGMRQEVTETAQYWVHREIADIEPVRQEVLRRAEKIGLEIYPEDVEVITTPYSLSINVYWVAPLEFPGYTYYREMEIMKTINR